MIVVPGLPPVTGGPYRFFSHPNYVAVVVEGAALPLLHLSWVTALVFTVANAALLTVRLRVEDAALATLPGRSRSVVGEPVRDLVVAGGGPVGLAAALHARRAGLDVVVVEPRAGDVDKACGEGLMPGALARLADLGVEVGRHRPGGHPLPRRPAQRRRPLPARAGPRGAAYDVARGVVAPPRRGGRRGPPRGGALGRRPRHPPAGRRPADPLPARRRRPALPRAPAARAGRAGARRAALRPALPPAGRAVERLRRGALGAGRGGLRHPGRPRPRRAGGAERAPRALRHAARGLRRAARAGRWRRAHPRARRRPAAPAARHRVAGGCCWSATRPATSTR